MIKKLLAALSAAGAALSAVFAALFFHEKKKRTQAEQTAHTLTQHEELRNDYADIQEWLQEEHNKQTQALHTGDTAHRFAAADDILRKLTGNTHD